MPKSVRNQSLTVIVYVRNEARFCHASLKSINVAARQAAQSNLKIKVIIVADKSDRATKAYLNDFAKQALDLPLQVHFVSYGSRAEAVNFAVNEANTEVVAILQAGDVCSPNWLTRAAEWLQRSETPIILHPEVTFEFGARERLLTILSSSDQLFSHDMLAAEPYFPFTAVARKEVFSLAPYVAAASDNQETWRWNASTLAQELEHVLVPETLICKRLYTNQESQVEPLLIPSDYFSAQKMKAWRTPAQISDQPEAVNAKTKALRITRSVIDRIYKTRGVRVVTRRHQRIGVYITSLRNETLHLLRDPEPASVHMISPWIQAALLELHNLDFSIFPRSDIETVAASTQPRKKYRSVFTEIALQTPDQLDLLLIMPFVKNGGTERVVTYMIDYYFKQKPDAKIAVLTTEDSDSPWLKHFDKRVQHLAPTESFHQLSAYEKQALVGMLVIQKRPKKIHIVNSPTAYQMLETYAKDIHSFTKIFISIFNLNKTPDGKTTHMFTEHLMAAVDEVDTVFTDNQAIVNQLVGMMAAPIKTFQVIYQPINTSRIKTTSKLIDTKLSPESSVKVLWANRLAAQKRVDVLTKVAEAATKQGMKIEFHVYGEPMYNDPLPFELIKACSIIYYHGAYEGRLDAIDTSEYDVFLLTSEREGVPNVLLEAITEGLLVIAPNVGGVSELVNDQTGYLIEQFDAVDQYIAALRKATKNPTRAQRLIRNAQQLVETRHTQQNYEAELAKEKTYFT